MRIIQRLIFMVTGVLGASVGALTVLFANWAFHLGLGGMEAFFYGLFGGLLLGWLIAIYVSIVVMRMIRRKIMMRFGGVFSIAHSFFRNRRF